MISSFTERTITVLHNQGYRFNIVTEVDRKVELHHEVERLDGRVQVRFIAELDGYGNVTEWGFEDEQRELLASKVQFDADGEKVA